MKKLLAIIAGVVLIAACTDTKELEKRISTIEKRLTMTMATGAGASFRPYSALSGGGTGALDKTDGSSLSLGDVAFVALNADATYGTVMFAYVYRDYGGAISEALPYVVKPDTNPNANYAWFLAMASSAPPTTLTSARAITPSECRSGVIFLTTIDTATLPKASDVGYGTTVCIIARDAEVATVDLDAADKFFIAGAAKGAGVTITSDGAAGDYWCGVAVTDADAGGTDGWWTLGMGATAWQ
jgi:hypothetical protein